MSVGVFLWCKLHRLITVCGLSPFVSLVYIVKNYLHVLPTIILLHASAFYRLLQCVTIGASCCVYGNSSKSRVYTTVHPPPPPPPVL